MKFKHEKTFRLAFKFRRHDFTRCFYEKIVNNICSKQRIIYAKKRENNFFK